MFGFSAAERRKKEEEKRRREANRFNSDANESAVSRLFDALGDIGSSFSSGNSHSHSGWGDSHGHSDSSSSCGSDSCGGGD